ncbi:MAG: AI-2E family transporter [Firmicutes bacterium]|nr:AI-2E family transporter [Bacillota bacterium]
MKNKLEKEVNKNELNDVISLSKKILKVLYFVFIACLVLASIIACQKLNVFGIVFEFIKVISPFFIGFVVAWLLRPLVLKLNEKIHNNTLSSIIVFAAFVLILLILLYTFIPTVYTEVNELVGLLPGFVERITDNINELFAGLADNGLNLGDFKDKLLLNITSLSTDIAKGLPSTIINMVVSLFSGIGTFVMGLIIGIYMLIDYENIGKHFKNMFPKSLQNDVYILSSRMSTEVRKCVNGTFLVALMVLVCDSIGFALVGLNAPLLFGLVCGITDLIPYIGPYIGGAAAVIVGFTQDPLIGIGTLIICVIVQIVESYILQPIVMSKASNLHPIVIIIALLVFGHFFGILGMVLATPCLAVLRVLFEFAKEKYPLLK